ncbi:MAG: serine hydrolase, partial [Waterburya sp.]
NLTIRQLLNGTGGLWDYATDEKFYSDSITDYLSGSNKDWQPEDLITYAFDKPLFSGERSTEEWTYTNTGNVIAALIAEEATGETFKQILNEEILKPLGLKNTFFSVEDVSLEERARGYEDIFTADGNLAQDGILEEYSSTEAVAYGDGSIVSTSEDVAIFFNSLASGELLSPESTAEIFNYVNAENSAGNNLKFGLGVFAREYPWGETRSMTGADFGYTSEVDYFLDSDTTISVLINSGSIGDYLANNSSRSDLVRQAYKSSIANTLNLNDDSAIDGTQNKDSLIGTSNNDIINGDDSDDTLQGAEGLDALDGGIGNDLIGGSQGDDILFGKEGEDSLNGGEDHDFLNGGENSDRLDGQAGDDSLVGGDGNDAIDGGADSDVLDGGTGNDELSDRQGSNTLYGNDGDDLLFAGMEDDALYGDVGSDRILAAAGNDQLFGGSGNDQLDGGVGDDNLIGGEGNDIITGLAGKDTLAGDQGSDRFSLSLEGSATITDFTPGEDFLVLPENISFADLEFIQGQGDNAANTLVTFESETIAVFENVDYTNISQSDFVT